MKTKNPKIIYFDLGYIGNIADKLQDLFKEYSKEPNEYGFFLKFENFSELVVNVGVIVATNCFSCKKDFMKRLNDKLMQHYAGCNIN
jgi:hypothetical protein